jgi:hypothetical protein
MGIDEYLYYLWQCYSLGDAIYISLVMLNGKYEGNAPHTIKGRTVINGKEFEACKSFTNKEICLIVAKYYTWVDGGTSELNIAQEIYGHAMLYYNYNAVKSVLGETLAQGIEDSGTNIHLGDDPLYYPAVYEAVWDANIISSILVVTVY